MMRGADSRQGRRTRARPPYFNVRFCPVRRMAGRDTLSNVGRSFACRARFPLAFARGSFVVDAAVQRNIVPLPELGHTDTV